VQARGESEDEGETKTSRWSQQRERRREPSLPSSPTPLLRLGVLLLLLAALPFIRVPSFPQAESNQYFGKVRG